MTVISIFPPRPVSEIDAKSVRIGSNPPATNNSNTPIGTSPEAQERSPVDYHPANPPGYRLLDALWRSPDRFHQIGVWYPQRKKFKNLPVNDVADAVAQALKLSSEGVETYFACAEYQTPDSRTAANASGACAFWCDIDCGKGKAAAGKGYATANDAEDALIDFCNDTGLPNSTHLVYSGGGLHAYWVLDGVITRDEWQEYAKKLKALTKARGFLADDSRTSDIASVLRVPGTLNYKYSPPKPVTLENASTKFIGCSDMLDAIDGAHTRLCSAVATKQPSRRSTASTSTTTPAAAEPTGNPDGSLYGPPDLLKLESALATLPPDCDEETWKLKRLAPLALAARNYPELCSVLYELAQSWSSGELCGQESTAWITPGGNGLTGEEAFDAVWQRFLKDGYTGTPVTLGTIYYDAKLNGWDHGDQFQFVDGDDEGVRDVQ